MATAKKSAFAALMGNIIVRLVLYYGALVGLMAAAWRFVPHTQLIARESLDALFSAGTPTAGASKADAIPVAVDQSTLARQRHRLVRARSSTSSPRPFITAFTMNNVKPFAIWAVILGGSTSSCRLTRASTSTGPSCARASRRPGST